MQLAEKLDVSDDSEGEIQIFSDEKEMLSTFKTQLLELDPEILVGYQLNVFDLWFLIERAWLLGINNFSRFGRRDG